MSWTVGGTTNRPGQKWGADVTYVKINQSCLYLAVVLDLFDRKIVGCSTSRNMGAESTMVSATARSTLESCSSILTREQYDFG